jgi:Ethanolamine utilization protein EutJ (predicted chaperonin)
MSHYATIELKCKNAEALIKALQRVNNNRGKKWTSKQIEVHKDKTVLNDWCNNPTKLKGNIVIRNKYVSDISNDVGFELMKDGTYKAHYDEGTFGKQFMDELMTYYGVELAKMEAEKQGHKVTETTDEKKRIVLEIAYTDVKKVVGTQNGIQVVNW